MAEAALIEVTAATTPDFTGWVMRALAWPLQALAVRGA